MKLEDRRLISTALRVYAATMEESPIKDFVPKWTSERIRRCRELADYFYEGQEEMFE